MGVLEAPLTSIGHFLLSLAISTLIFLDFYKITDHKSEPIHYRDNVPEEKSKELQNKKSKIERDEKKNKNNKKSAVIGPEVHYK